MDTDLKQNWFKHPIVISGMILGVFAILGSALISAAHWSTAARIAEVERQMLLDNIFKLVPKNLVDNDLLSDKIEIVDPALSKEPIVVYRAKHLGQDTALVLSPVDAPGYAGPIRLIIAIMADGSLGGVRVVAHKETPGLGDKIEEKRTDWILGFSGKSLSSPSADQWKVKRDGGQFDQFTGATITPRSIVTKVRETLEYFGKHKDQLFAQSTEAKS